MSGNGEILGGWSITQQCLDWMVENVPSGSKVLEFGSGMGTGELVKHFDMTSIEQDAFWCNGFSGSRYIHAPLDGHWYSWEALEAGNLENDYAMIIIDGPTRFSTSTQDNLETARMGICDYYLANSDLFHDCYIVIDDTDRPKDMAVCEFFLEQGFEKIAEQQCPICPKNKQFSVVRKPY